MEPSVATDWAKYELIDGRECAMSPAGTWHNSIGMNLCRIIGNYLRGKRCKIFYETKVIFDENNHFIPDLIIVCDRNKIKVNAVQGAPDLVIEILSFSTRKKDIGVKKDTYEKFGVKEYWLVSPRERTVTVYRLQGGKFVLHGVCGAPSDEELEGLTDKEKEEFSLSLKVSLYDDLTVNMREVFED